MHLETYPNPNSPIDSADEAKERAGDTVDAPVRPSAPRDAPIGAVRTRGGSPPSDHVGGNHAVESQRSAFAIVLSVTENSTAMA